MYVYLHVVPTISVATARGWREREREGERGGREREWEKESLGKLEEGKRGRKEERERERERESLGKLALEIGKDTNELDSLWLVWGLSLHCVTTHPFAGPWQAGRSGRVVCWGLF